VPTASLAAVLVFTGYKLINPANVKKLLNYGGAPVFIYAATLVTIVVTDLLTGILAGLALSVVKVLYGLTHMEVRITRNSHAPVDLHIIGAATFIRMPRLVDALNSLPPDADVRICFDGLVYIDHACLDAISNWERQRSEKGVSSQVEWTGLMARYHKNNSLQPAEVLVEAS